MHEGVHLLVKNLHFWIFDPEKKIYLYIGKWINGKFWISKFLGEKSGFFLSWSAHFTPYHPHFWIFFITNIKIKLAKVSLKSEVPQGMLVLLVASKIKMAATAKWAIGCRKYFGWLTYSMVGLIDISFEKIGDFEFGWLFVA